MTTNHLEFSRLPYDAYIDQLARECASDTALPEISYRYETEAKTQAIAQSRFSYLYSLGSLSYQLIHWLAGRCIKISISFFLSKFTKQRSATLDPETDKNIMRAFLREIDPYYENQIPLDPELWKYKRISIAVGDITIDAMLVVRSSFAENGNWILHSNAAADYYELHKRYPSCPKKLALSLNANILIFNYPGVGASQGSYNRETIAKTYQAMLRFLEDKEKGIAAHTIIGEGYCMGGNIQGDALKDYELQPGIKYVFIKDRNAFEFSTAASRIGLCGLGKLFELCGWNMDTLSSSKQLNAHEILLHTADVKQARQVRDPDLLIADGVLTKEDTLGYHILKNQNLLFDKKLARTTVIGIPERHDRPLSSNTRYVLCEKIKDALEDDDYGDIECENSALIWKKSL